MTLNIKNGVNNCWSSPILKTSITKDECDKLFTDIMIAHSVDSKTGNKKRKNFKGLGDKSDKSMHIRQIDIEKDLLLRTCADRFFGEYFDKVLGINLKDFDYRYSSAFNINRGKGSMPIHQHQEVDFISVVYLYAEAEDGQIVLHDPRWAIASKGYKTEFLDHYGSIEFTPKTGDVLVMPAYIYHSVKQSLAPLRVSMPIDLIINSNDEEIKNEICY